MIPWTSPVLKAPTRLDVLGAAAVLVLGVLEVTTGQLDGPVGLAWVSVVVYVGCVLLRRTALWACVIIAFGTIVVTYALGLSQQDYLASIVAGLILVTWVGFSFDRLEALLGFGYAFACVAPTNDPTALGNDAWLLLVIGGSWTAGRALRSRRLLIDDLRRTTTELERSREELATRAVAEDRLRIAQEIHDVIAHSVTVMLVQAEAAERVLPDHPDAQEAIAAVHETGRQALVELRQLLGVLRPGESRTGISPQPGLADLPALLSSYHAAGLVIHAHRPPAVPALPATLELTAYRVAQEALTNVLRHSTAREAALDIDATGSVLRVEVTDPGPPQPGDRPRGHGLEGMQERVAACGGTLEAGPCGTGFKVSATLPLEVS